MENHISTLKTHLRGYEDIQKVFLCAGKESRWLSSSEYELLNEEVKSMISDCEERHGSHAMIFISNADNIARLHRRIQKRMQPGDGAITFLSDA